MAVRGSEPQPILRGITSALPPPSPDALPLGIAGFQFFVFGGFNKTMDWIQAIAVARPSATVFATSYPTRTALNPRIATPLIGSHHLADAQGEISLEQESS